MAARHDGTEIIYLEKDAGLRLRLRACMHAVVKESAPYPNKTQRVWHSWYAPDWAMPHSRCISVPQLYNNNAASFQSKSMKSGTMPIATHQRRLNSNALAAAPAPSRRRCRSPYGISTRFQRFMFPFLYPDAYAFSVELMHVRTGACNLVVYMLLYS